MPAGAEDTIFALSSGPLPAAIAVVRVSGPAAGPALRQLAGSVPPPRKAVVASLIASDGSLLDRALLLWLPAPGSVTGEDLAELHLHGGRATVAAVLAALADLPGLRRAEPGEFTRRALLNGRLDLTQVEGLADLLSAETEGQRRAALRSAEGGLGRLVEQWRRRLLELSAMVEASIEFAEEHEDVALSLSPTTEDLGRLAGEMRAMVCQPPAERLRDGVRIVIAGPVNAGKSTLLNALAGREAAIASPVAGTTRDLIEVPMIFRGTACILVDGAGLRTAGDPVERIGVERVRAAISTADLVIWLGAAADRPPVAHCLIVHAQADRPGRELPAGGADLSVSARTGQGMTELQDAMVDRITALLPAEDRVTLNSRHRALVSKAAATLLEAGREQDELLRAENLRSARWALDRIVGASGTEDMLDALFSRFCVGK